MTRTTVNPPGMRTLNAMRHVSVLAMVAALLDWCTVDAFSTTLSHDGQPCVWNASNTSNSRAGGGANTGTLITCSPLAWGEGLSVTTQISAVGGSEGVLQPFPRSAPSVRVSYVDASVMLCVTHTHTHTHTHSLGDIRAVQWWWWWGGHNSRSVLHAVSFNLSNSTSPLALTVPTTMMTTALLPPYFESQIR